MRLVWLDSGDSLNLRPEHPHMMAAWLEALQHNNGLPFNPHRNRPDEEIDRLITTLKDTVDAVNDMFQKVKIRLPTSDDVLDQDYLNDLHRSYVKFEQRHDLVSLSERIGGEAGRATYGILNATIHRIEKTKIYYYLASPPHWTMPNLFGTDLLKFGRWHVEIHYESLGRSTYEKWVNYDNNWTDSDTDDFQSIGGRLQFNIGRPYKTQPPEDYVIACRSAGVEPIGEVLPVGNFMEPIGTIRNLFHRNQGPLTLHT